MRERASKIIITFCLIGAGAWATAGCATFREGNDPDVGPAPTWDVGDEARPQGPRPTAPSARPKPIRAGEPDADRVDMPGLQRSLGLGRGSALGFEERAFDTCQVGYGYASGENCRARTFVAIRLRIECRASDGTEQSADYQTWPLGATDLTWTLAGQRGSMRTNGEGQAEMAMIAPASAREQKLRITRANDFLLVTAEEARRIVAPRSWCGR